MHETELQITRLFNDHLAGLGNTLLGVAGMHPHPRPWANFVVMELLVAAVIVVLFAVLRSRLSVDRPGAFQHTLEVVYEFISGESHDQVGHSGGKYLGYFGTIF